MSVVDGRVSNQSLQRQIAELFLRVNQIADGIDEIKAMLHQVEERVRKLETSEAGAHPLMEARIDAAWRKLEEHDKRIEQLTQIASRLDHSNRVITWLGGVLGGAVLVWLVTQILQVVK